MEVLSTVIDRLRYYIHNNGNIHDFIALTLNDCDLGESLSLSACFLLCKRTGLNLGIITDIS